MSDERRQADRRAYDDPNPGLTQTLADMIKRERDAFHAQLLEQRSLNAALKATVMELQQVVLQMAKS